jgi:probable F420-dependent oxidoreductase
MADFGVRLPVAGPLATTEAIVNAAVAAEDLGFETAWVYDHLVWSRKQDQTHISVGSLEAFEEAAGLPTYGPNFFESLTTMAYLAAKTSRIRIGVAVMCLPYRRPLVAAKQLATLDVLSGGRLTVGLGSGALKKTGSLDFEALGVPRTEKYDRAYEYTDVVLNVWHNDPVSYSGRFVKIPDVEVYPKPVQKPHPPLWIAAKWDKSGQSRGMDIVAQFGDGWFIGGKDPSLFPPALASMRELAAKHGRPDQEFKLAKEMSVCIAETSERARDISRRTLEASVGHFSARATLEDAINGTFVGSPDEIASKVAAFVEGGIDHFELKFMYHNEGQLIEQLHLWSDEIIPKFRD